MTAEQALNRTFKNWSGRTLEVVGIDYAADQFVCRDTDTGLIEQLATYAILSGPWYAVETPARCECGTTITMGKDDHPMFHSPDYCPIYRKEG